MKTVTRYQASDGEEFKTSDKCEAYERLIADVKQIMRPFGELPRDRGCNFANGGGYIQHSLVNVAVAKEQLVELGKKVLHLNRKEGINWGYFGRCVGEINNRPLYFAWCRLSNIDVNGREWGQEYFAINPDKGKQVPYKESK